MGNKEKKKPILVKGIIVNNNLYKTLNRIIKIISKY